MSADYRIASLVKTQPALKSLESLCDDPNFRGDMLRLALDDTARRREEKLVRTYRTTDLTQVLNSKIPEAQAASERAMRFTQEHTLVSLIAETIDLIEAALSKITNTTNEPEDIISLLEFVEAHGISLVKHTQKYCKEDARPEAVTTIAMAPERAMMPSLDTKGMEYIADRLTALIEQYLKLSFRRSISSIQNNLRANEPTEIIHQPQGRLAAWFNRFSSANKIEAPTTKNPEPDPINISTLLKEMKELQFLMRLLLTTMWRNPELSLTTHLNEMDAIVSKKLLSAK